jgi:hypothetical protein
MRVGRDGETARGRDEAVIGWKVGWRRNHTHPSRLGATRVRGRPPKSELTAA